MCGIAGYLTSNRRPPESSLIQAMCDQLMHRGPDAAGYFQTEAVSLGHRRLSIIDVSGGDQPLGNEDGTIQIVFNGEIYNYRELRKELLEKGHRFATNSDTEVLVHLYEEVGPRLPEYLNGMFAFAIWDSRKDELFLARDRLGKKPLYYATGVTDFRFCFASELKSFTALPAFDRTPNPRSIANFLQFSYVPDPDTIFRGVQKLPPGHTLLVSRDGAKLARYWKPEFRVEPDPGVEPAMEEILDLARDSVGRRMISDVPLGGFLSGGVDSGSIVALMAEQAKGPIASFSIGFSNREFDELSYARLVADRYKTEHHEHVVTPSIEEMLQVLVEHYDEPFADSSAIPTLYLSRMTRQYVTVALSGDGADEIFGGYRRYRFAVAEESVRGGIPGWLRHGVFGTLAKYYPKFDYLPRVFRAKATLRGISQELGEAYFSSMTAFGWGLYDRVLSPGLREALHEYSPEQWYLEKFKTYSELPPLLQLQAVDLETYLPGDILVKLDRASMAFSLEARCPWLDYRIAELAGRFPPSFKLHRGVGKRIMKDTMRPFLPDDIIDRPKMGFGVPMAEWMRSSLKLVFQMLVFRPEMAEFLDLDAVAEIWQTHQAGRRDFGRELWTLLMLACWQDRYGGGRSGSLLAEALAASVERN